MKYKYLLPLIIIMAGCASVENYVQPEHNYSVLKVHNQGYIPILGVIRFKKPDGCETQQVFTSADSPDQPVNTVIEVGQIKEFKLEKDKKHALMVRLGDRASKYCISILTFSAHSDLYNLYITNDDQKCTMFLAQVEDGRDMPVYDVSYREFKQAFVDGWCGKVLE